MRGLLWDEEGVVGCLWLAGFKPGEVWVFVYMVSRR